MDIPIKLIMLANTKGANQTSKALSKVEKNVAKLSVAYFKQAAAAEKSAKKEAGLRSKHAGQVKRAAAEQKKTWSKLYKAIDKDNAKSTARSIRNSARSTSEISKDLKRTEVQKKKIAKIDMFKSGGDFDRQLASTRYAMYDIGRRALVFGTAIAGGFAAATKSAIDFESAFTSVERTSEVTLNSNIPEVRLQAEILRDTLIQMSVDLPVAFADIAEVATLGAQLGLAANELDEFTESVSKFSAITGISVDTVALSFGRLAELMDVPASKFENLSSAIAFTGINAVATDAEILKMAESISAAASVAGFAADETVGLASALSSLKVRPQAARGVLTRLFRNFDLAVDESGAKLDDLGRIISLTSLESAKLWKQDPSGFFKKFLEGAKATGQLNSTLKALGIVNVRELDVIQRLSANMPVLTDALADTKEQFELGTYSSEAYALVVDDTASKIIKMQNAIEALGASFGDLLNPAIAIVVDQIAGFANGVRESSPLVKVFLAAVGALVGGLSLFFASVAFGIAGILALKLAFQNLTGSTIQAGIGLGTFKALLLSMVPASAGVTTINGLLGHSFTVLAAKISAASLAAKGLMLSLGVLSAVLVVVTTMAAFNEAAREQEKELKKAGDAALEAAGGLEAFAKASQEGLANGEDEISRITLSLRDLTKEEIASRKASLEANVERERMSVSMGEGAEAFNKAKDKLKEFNNEIERNKGLNTGESPKGDADLSIFESTKRLMLDSLANIAGADGETFSIFDSLATKITPEIRAKFEKAGIDINDVMVEATNAAATGGSASDYFVGVLKEVDGLSGKMAEMLLSGEDSMAVDAYGGAILGLEGILSDFGLAAGHLDLQMGALNDEIDAKVWEDYMKGTEDVIPTIEQLNDQLRATINILTSEEISENKVSDALDAFAKGAQDSSGELDGLGVSAKENLSNFASFLDDATEASILAGESIEGATSRIIGGLNALDDAGIDTSDAFKLVKELIIDSVIKINGANNELRKNLAEAPNLEGMKKIIKSFYFVKIAAAESRDVAFEFISEMTRALAGLTGMEFTLNLPEIEQTTGRALTALEKLLAMLEKLYKPSNAKLGALKAVSGLGEALQKNGKVFTDWTDAGIDNMSTMEDTITSLATSSDGNTQVFANSLGALRAALIQVGVSGAGLKKIDQAIKENGKSAKVSKNQTKQFYAQLADTDSAKRALLQIADAIGEVQSAISAGLSATFAQGRAIDDVTLGWLDLTDAQDGARKSIESANDAIVEANRSIQEANDSINELTADSGKLEYQLQIAIKYGDTLRADAIRAELDTIDTEIAAKEKDITDANKAVLASQDEIADANSKLGINSTTRDIIEQNRALQDMAGKYGDVAAFMITTAKPGEDLTAIINKQVEAFKQNAIQMGYTEAEAQAVADVLRTELIASMDAIPENIKTLIEAETDAALTKVQKFAKDANARLASIKSKTITVTTIEQTVRAYGGRSANPTHRAAGGMIRGPGTGTSDSIPARLSNGEFVVKAAAVKHYGPDFFNSLNQMKSPSAPMNRSSAPATSSSTVYLSTEDRQLLRSAIDRPVALYTDNTIIAKSANAGNTLLAQRGIR